MCKYREIYYEYIILIENVIFSLMKKTRQFYSELKMAPRKWRYNAFSTLWISLRSISQKVE